MVLEEQQDGWEHFKYVLLFCSNWHSAGSGPVILGGGLQPECPDQQVSPQSERPSGFSTMAKMLSHEHTS